MAIDETRGRRMLFGAWLTLMGVIMWQEIKVNGRAPEPSRLTGATVAMAMLDLAAPVIGWPVAGVMGLGLAIGLSLMRVATPTPAPNQPGEPSHVPGATGVPGAQTSLTPPGPQGQLGNSSRPNGPAQAMP